MIDHAVVLTATIDSGKYDNIGNVITDIEERRREYYESLERYIKESVFKKIVFIENSDSDFNVKYFRDLAKIYNKKFEFIRGSVLREEIIVHGKSFGDAYLVYEALEKSQLLKNEKRVFKISGRIFLQNSWKVARNSSRHQNQYIVYHIKKWCLTNIFKCNIEDYKKWFSDIYLECDEKSGKDFERCMYKRLQTAPIEVGKFYTYPFFIGRQGANKKLYTKGGMDYLLRNLLLKLGCFNFNSKTQSILKVLFPIYDKITKRSGRTER